MSRARGRLSLVGLIALVLVLGAGLGLLLRGVGRAREAAFRSVCHGHLFHINIALQNYHDTHGAFPPAFVADPQGRPMHSWRVLILPFLEYSDLYNAYNFDQPWDGPDNLALQSQMPETFACPTHRGQNAVTPFTSYVAVTGPDTVWGRSLDALQHPAEDVLMMVETTADVPWTAPFDLPVSAIVGASAPFPQPASDHEDGFHVSTAGSPTRVFVPTPGWRARLAAMASIHSDSSRSRSSSAALRDTPHR